MSVPGAVRGPHASISRGVQDATGSRGTVTPSGIPDPVATAPGADTIPYLTSQVNQRRLSILDLLDASSRAEVILRRAIENRKGETRQSHRSPEEDEFRQPAAMLEEINGGIRIGKECR